MRTLADAEADLALREQLRDIAYQYDQIANSAVPVRRMLSAMWHDVASHRTAEQQAADNSRRAVQNGKPTG